MDNGDHVYEAEEEFKPATRSGHVSVSFGKVVLIWGGYHHITEFNEGGNNGSLIQSEYLPSSRIWLYHTDIQKWYCQQTDGKAPPGTSGASAVAVDNKMFVFGGHTEEGNSNELYVLDTSKWTWDHIVIDDSVCKPSPRDKAVMWEYNKKLYVFGGYGPGLYDCLCDNGTFELDTNGFFSHSGWNNQVLIFDLKTKTWSNPECTGPIPSARAAHSAVCLENIVYIFGGRHKATRLNDMHCLDLETLQWSGSVTYSKSIIPRGRSWHSMSRLSNNTLVLYGGYSHTCVPLSDVWVFDVTKSEWSRLNLNINKPRLWHTACTTEDDDVFIFGGCSSDILNSDLPAIHCDDIILIRTKPKSLHRQCLEAAYQHRNVLKKEWKYLPKPLFHILSTRSYGEQSTVKGEAELLSKGNIAKCTIS